MAARAPKYKAKHVYWDAKNECAIGSTILEKYRVKNRLKLPEHIWRFDSQHEFRVYLELVRMYGSYYVLRQQPIEIIEPSYCYPKGKIWKVDFAVCSPNLGSGIIYFVEAKGCFLPEFAYTLSALEQIDFSEFRKLKVIFPSTIPKTNKVIKALLDSHFNQNLLTLSDLKLLSKLP